MAEEGIDTMDILKQLVEFENVGSSERVAPSESLADLSIRPALALRLRSSYALVERVI